MNQLNKLQSWIFWRNQYRDTDSNIRKFLDSLGYRFPDQSMVFKSLYSARNMKACPFCDGWGKTSPINESVAFCLCILLEWQHGFSKFISKYSMINQHTTTTTLIARGSTHDQKASMQNAIDITNSWIENPEKWVVFIGPNGVGKTHMMGAMKHSVEPISLYISAGAFEGHLFRTRNIPEQDQFRAAIAEIPILFFDDWGMEYGGKWVNSSLNNIIDSRYSQHKGKITIVATNKSKQEMKDTNMRIASRLADTRIMEEIVILTTDARRELVNG